MDSVSYFKTENNLYSILYFVYMKKEKELCYLHDYEDKAIEITVIKQTGTCHAGHKVGDKFYCTDHKTPEGFGSWACSAIFPYIAGVAHGAKFPWEKNKCKTTACCSDPANPVIFEIKAKDKK